MFQHVGENTPPSPRESLSGVRVGALTNGVKLETIETTENNQECETTTGEVDSSQAARFEITTVREVTAVYRNELEAGSRIQNSREAAEFIRRVLPDNSREHLICIYLGGGDQIIAYAVVATGTADSCQSHPREIFQLAVLQGAISIVIGHNHPGPDVFPSDKDVKATARIRKAGRLLGIKIKDHVIVNERKHYSFAERLF